MAAMTLMLPNIPAELDAALRKKADAEGKPLDQVAVDAMRVGLGLAAAPIKRRDLSDLAGTWVEDPEFDKIMTEQDRIDPEMWR
jgi:hypothetical protein